MKYFLFIILLPINLLILFFVKILKKFINFKLYKVETEKMGHFLFNTLLFLERKNNKAYHEKSKINFIIPFIDISVFSGYGPIIESMNSTFLFGSNIVLCFS